MGTRYKTLFNDVHTEVEWTVRILDTSYVGAELDMNLEREAFELTHGENGIPISAAIIGSQCDVFVLVDNDTWATFIDTIATEQEDKYYIQIDKNGAVFWRGKILQDQIRVEFKPQPYGVRLRATDGLATLKDRRAAITNYDSILRTIIEILDYLDPDSLFLPDEAFVRTSVRWFENQTWTTSAPNALDGIAYSRLPSRLSTEYDIGADGEPAYRSWYDWLEGVLTAFGARVMLSEGIWWVEQVTELATPSLSRYNTYSKQYALTAGAPPAVGMGGFLDGGTLWTNYHLLTTTGAANQYDRVLKGSQYGYNAALKDYRLRFAFNQAGYVGFGYVRTPSSEVAVGTIQAGDLLQLYLTAFWFKWEATVAGTYTIYPRVRVRVRLDAGTDRYLQQSANGTWDWVTSVQQIEILSGQYGWNTAFLNIGDTELQEYSWLSSAQNPRFTTAAPVDGTIYIQFEILALNASGTTLAGITLDSIVPSDGIPYDKRGLFYNLFNATAQGYSELEFLAENGTLTTSSAVQEDEVETFIGDAPFINANNRLQVYTTSSTWEDSDAWKFRGTGTAYQLLQLNVGRFMRLTDEPRRLFDLRYRGEYLPHLSLRVNGLYYMVQKAMLSGRTGFVDVEALEIVDSGNNPTLDEVRGFQVLPEGVISGPGGGGKTALDGVMTTAPSGATSSLSVSSLTATLGKAGQYVTLLSPSGISSATLRLAADANAGDTTVSINSYTFTAGDFPAGSVLRAALQVNQTEIVDSSWRGLPATVLLLPEGFRGSPSAVSGWVDSSGQGNDFSVVGTPTIETEDGKILAGCTSTNSFALAALAGVNQPFNVAFSVRDYSGAITLFEDNVAPAVSVEITSATDITANAGVGDVLTFTAGFKVVQVEFNGASSRIRVDSQPWQTLNAGANVPATVDALFKDPCNAAAFGLWNYALTDAQADAIRNAFTTFV